MAQFADKIERAYAQAEEYKADYIADVLIDFKSAALSWGSDSRGLFVMWAYRTKYPELITTVLREATGFDVSTSDHDHAFYFYRPNTI